MAFPIPLLAPVTRATLGWSFIEHLRRTPQYRRLMSKLTSRSFQLLFTQLAPPATKNRQPAESVGRVTSRHQGRRAAPVSRAVRNATYSCVPSAVEKR